MTLAENLRTKYGLTSFGNSLPLLAINNALEAAAQIEHRRAITIPVGPSGGVRTVYPFVPKTAL